MKVVLGTVLEFRSFEDLVETCMDAVENNELTHADHDGVPENPEKESSWTMDVVKNFLKFNGGALYDEVDGDYDDIFNDNSKETRITIEE